MNNGTTTPETNTEVGGLVEPLVMTEQDHLIDSLSEHVQANAECVDRLALIVAVALPHTENDISGLLMEWRRINTEINQEYEAAIKKCREALPLVMPDWMDEARVLAAQCWCDKETENKVMDPLLAEAIAKRIAAWMDTAAQNQRNTDYYRGLVVRCGEAIGESAYMCEDGTRSEDVLCAKVPEIIEFDYREA